MQCAEQSGTGKRQSGSSVKSSHFVLNPLRRAFSIWLRLGKRETAVRICHDGTPQGLNPDRNSGLFDRNDGLPPFSFLS